MKSEGAACPLSVCLPACPLACKCMMMMQCLFASNMSISSQMHVSPAACILEWDLTCWLPNCLPLCLQLPASSTCALSQSSSPLRGARFVTRPTKCLQVRHYVLCWYGLAGFGFKRGWSTMRVALRCHSRLAATSAVSGPCILAIQQPVCNTVLQNSPSFRSQASPGPLMTSPCRLRAAHLPGARAAAHKCAADVGC